MDAPAETAAFFESLQAGVQVHRSIRVDLSQVESVTLDALAYLLALARDQNLRCQLSGNFPRLPAASEFVRRSGFLSYLSSSADQLQPEDDTYGIHRGSNVDPLIADRLIQFVQKHLSIPHDTPETRALYTVLIECMANTCNHAFIRFGREAPRHWYVMARYRPGNQCVEFAFLDSGLGIPATIRKHLRDVLLVASTAKDSELIASALSGDLRTRTREGKRGKGLPKIKGHATSGHLKALRIQSLKGCVFLDGDAAPRMSKSNWRFKGTLLTWKVTAPESS